MEYCKRERRVVISIRLSVCGSFCVKCASKALLLMCLVQSSLGFGSVYSHSLLFDLLHSQYRHIFTWFSQFVPSRNPRRSFVFLDSRCSSRNPSLQSQTRAYTKNIQWTLWSTPDVSLFLRRPAARFFVLFFRAWSSFSSSALPFSSEDSVVSRLRWRGKIQAKWA